jgi:PKD repeat protein
MTMKKYLFAVTCFLASSQLFAQSCIDSSLIDLSAICPTVFIPTCGCDSVVYSNPCEALHYGGVTSYRLGLCGSDTFCASNFNAMIQQDSVFFINTSTALDSINWFHYDFGNGDTSNSPNPLEIFHYSVDTSFIVCLTIYTQSGCLNQFCRYLRIPASLPDSCFANFTYSDSANHVQFYDASIFGVSGIVFYSWNFGDSTTSSVANPTHNYTFIGSHFPCLTIKVVTGVDTCQQTICKEVITSSPPCIDAARIDSTQYCPNVNPVCGCDSITYTNSCYAEHYHGITSWHDGPCYAGVLNQSFSYQNIIIFPNPTNDYAYMQSTAASDMWYSVYDIRGNAVLGELKYSLAGIDLTSLKVGIYFVRIKINDTFSYLKLVKK